MFLVVPFPGSGSSVLPRILSRACLHGEKALEQLALDSVNRRGKSIKCDVACTPLLGPGDEVRGAIRLMEESSDGRG